jgi:sulfopyruvate decarboxylase subunit beta
MPDGEPSRRRSYRGVIAVLMSQQQALEVLAAHRGDRLVVTSMSAAGIWPALSQHPLDFHYIPSAMGQAPSLALGLGLAQPTRGIIVVSGDGSMLMNLGSLVTLANHPANVCLVILDNGLYEVTGGQPVVGAGRTDFAGLARAAGNRRCYTFDSLADWSTGVAEVLSHKEPVVVWLKVEGRKGQQTPKPPKPMAEQVKQLRRALGVTE